MSSGTLRFVWWFPAAVALPAPPAPLAAQQMSFADRQLVAAGIWAAAWDNYAYWDAVLAERDAALERAREYLATAQRR